MKRIFSILVTTYAVLNISLLRYESNSNADQTSANPQITAQTFPIAADVPAEKIQAILTRHRNQLIRIPGVTAVGVDSRVILVVTSNPTLLPSEIEGVPVESRPVSTFTEALLESAGSSSNQTLTQTTDKQCPSDAYFDPEKQQCLPHNPLPRPPQPTYLPPPDGVIILRPGKVREAAATCPSGFKEVVETGNWRFCIDPVHPEVIPPLMMPPIAGIPYEKAKEIRERNGTMLIKLPGVTAVGLGPDGIVVETDRPELVPKEVEGLPVKAVPSPGIGKSLTHTRNVRRRPLHGSIAIRDPAHPNTTGYGNLTGVVLSEGKPWLVFPAHFLNDCGIESPCRPALTALSLPLNWCPQHNISSRIIWQPPQTGGALPPETVGFVQRWDFIDPFQIFKSADVAAAFMDNNSVEGDGSLSADRRIEDDFLSSFSGITADPVVGNTVKIVSAVRGAIQGQTHVVEGTITLTDIDQQVGTRCLNNGIAIYRKQTRIQLSSGCFMEGDSGSPVFNASGSLVGMINYGIIVQCQFGGGTSSRETKDVLGFDAWYGTQTVNDNTIGVFRPSTAQWFIDNGNGKYDGCTSAVPTSTRDQCLYYGISTDVPVTGDWDNATANNIPTNDFTIGIYRTATDPNQFYLDNSNSPPSTNPINFFTGPASFGYKPVAGKWQGANSATKVGVFRPSTGGWYLDNGNNVVQACGIDYCFFLFAGMYQPGDIPIAGDWNNDGIVSIGLFRPGLLASPDFFYLSNVNPATMFTNGTIFSWDHSIQSGPGNFGYLPLAGNWTGIGGTKVGVYKSGTGNGTPAGAWYLDNGNRSFPGCTEDQCPPAFGLAGDKPVAFGKSIVKAN